MDKYQKIVVTGLLIFNNKLLVVRRSLKEAFLPGEYELPGGKVDFGEQPDEALLREYMEEVNLKINVAKLLDAIGYVSDKNNRHTIELFYQVELDDNPENIKLEEDHDDFKWIAKDEIDLYIHGFAPRIIDIFKSSFI